MQILSRSRSLSNISRISHHSLWNNFKQSSRVLFISMKFLIVFAFLIAFEVNAQNEAQILSKELNVPFKPLDNSTRIVFPSEDTNMKRRPTHVSNQVSDRLTKWKKNFS